MKNNVNVKNNLMGRDLASLWYSPSNESACRKILRGWAWTGSGSGHSTVTMKLWPTAQGPFRAPSLCTICRASMKNSSVTKLLFCSLPGTKAQTWWANGHSYRMWCVVSSCCPQKEHFGSICTFCWARLDFVGRTLQHTLHIKVLTFGGTFRDHNFFHKCWSWEAEECSLEHDWLSRRATWYAVFTVNSRDLIFLPRQLISCIRRAHPNPQNVFHCGSSEGGSEDTPVPLVGHLIDQVTYFQILVSPIFEPWKVWKPLMSPDANGKIQSIEEIFFF